MKTMTTSRRARILGIGALLASVISLGASADTASASKNTKPDSEVVVEADVDSGFTSTSLRAGIRW